jgi:hypothetical protein
MEVYILDSLLRRDTVVDVFESVIWTERYREMDDFELTVLSTPVNRMRFITGTRLAVNTSDRVMTVETVENDTDPEGRNVLKIKGRGLEAIFEDRVILGQTSPYTFIPGYQFSGTPYEVMMAMFYRCCVSGDIHPNDTLPFYVDGVNLYPADTIPAPTDAISVYQKPTDLYTALKDLADVYDLGFRLYRDPVDRAGGKLYFNIYSGSDRSMLQSTLPPVVFSPELENLQNTRELENIQKAKNIAYVFYQYKVQVPGDPGDPTAVPPVPATPSTETTETMYEVVYADGMDPDAAGFERHEVYVEVSSIPDDVTADQIPAYLIRQGKDALAKTRPSSLLDGEINEYSQYKYKVDYFLGDLVTMQNSDGAANSMRVTEQIFVHDNNGERYYPTLIINQFIDPGAWISWNYNKVWADMGATEYWSNQP